MVEDNKETKVKTIEEYHEEAPRRWPVLLGYALAAVIVALLIVFGARAIYHHYHKPAAKTTSSTTRPTFSGSNTSGSSANSNKSTGSGGSGASSTNGQVPASLPNSGPGQVMGLFVGATLAAAGLHYIVNLRRSSKAN